MTSLIRFWNQNRKKLIVGIIAIVLLILLVQTLNQLATTQKESRTNSTIQNIENNSLPTQSIITEEKVDSNVTQENVKIIQEFIEYCNEGKTTEAYNLLTKECTQLLYPTEEIFKEEYYNLIFTEYKVCKIDNFRNSSGTYTYEVKFYNDALSQGKVINNGVYTDYMTINTKAKEGKLNINGFIRTKEINQTVEQDGICITILQQQIYKDSEKYEIKIENNTKNNILIDTRKQNRTVYIIGDNNATYSAYMNQIATNLLQIDGKFYRTYTIQFNKKYDPTIISKAIRFTDIVADEEKYQENKDTFTERINIKVEF